MCLVNLKHQITDPAVSGKMSSWSVSALCFIKEVRPLFRFVLIHMEMIFNVRQDFIVSLDDLLDFLSWFLIHYTVDCGLDHHTIDW